ncbi:restriction endonuclease subunit S [Shewanella sp. 10N.7]|uniref:restriction endonuclease subunit S n=1 Tax=Shewanella sp. 10N.7 TaxID=2885093 RepID=UPI001E3BA4B4|nr:restriction endonuclease subunit S [Shewanella sp. 10N.7]MCC4834546.1 restriction endonuclease subunit S [Shewanella sp. 10N.7]
MVWSVKKLGDVCNIIGGGTPTKSNKSFYEGVIPWATVRDMRNDRLSRTEMSITEEAIKKSSTNLIPSGTIITATRVGLGKVCVLEQDTAINQDLKAIIPKTERLDNTFLYWWLKSIAHVIVGAGTGATVQGVKLTFVKALEIPLPPIPEQKRIVALLDTVFADLEQTRAKTEQNLKNARELFESKKLNLFESLGVSSNLSSLPLVCDDIFAGGDAPKKGLFSKEQTKEFNIPIYANAVKNNGLYGFTDYSRADEPSITIAARGSGTGHIELRKEPFLPIVRLIVLTPNKEIIGLEYLKYALQTLDILRSGSAIPQLTVPMIKEYSLPVPDMITQEKIVSELQSLKLYIDKIEAIYRKKILKIDELKKSILQKAFSGELTHD